MTQPSLIEMMEYETLRNEFKDYAEASKHPRLSNLNVLATGLHKTDPCYKVYQKLERYDRYLELRMMIAPYLYDLLLKHGVKP